MDVASTWLLNVINEETRRLIGWKLNLDQYEMD
jgi:hypothetical protein